MPPKIISKDLTYVSPLQQLQTRPAGAKRIRVSRACDTCRRRKVKCDGKQPCIHCTVYSYECTYNQYKPPPAKKTKRDTQKTAGSATGIKPENDYLGLKMMERMFPEIDTTDPGFNIDLFMAIFDNHKTSGVIDLNAVISEYNTTSEIKIGKTVRPLEIKIIIPPKDIAIKLIYRTWNDACQLFRFYHRTSFIKDVLSLYETPPEEYSNHQNKMLPLVYSVIAVGALFSKGDNAIDNQYLQDEGYRYFIAARKLIDITNSTDIESIQTIFMLTMFLQCSARLSTCYSYIGIALRSALRQGLHRMQQIQLNEQRDYIKEECRKRLFWTIYKMEIYVNSMLGLPNSIHECDINAPLPLDIDDSNIDHHSLKPQAKGKPSSVGVNNCHTKLILILNHIVEKIYKSETVINATTLPTDTIKHLENELKVWLYELPAQLKPNEVCPTEYIKANKLLHLDYLHVQIMLYHPFIHLVKENKGQEQQPNSFEQVGSYQYQNGIKCFAVSQEIIALAEEMIDKKLMNGSYWFSIYTIFFAVACLVYYFLEVDCKSDEINGAIEKGKRILSNLKQKSVSAERIYDLLNHMFETYDRHNLRFDELTLHSEGKAQTKPKALHHSQSEVQIKKEDLFTTAKVPIVRSQSQQQKSLSQPQFNINPTQGNSILDDFDLRIFGKFLPEGILGQGINQPTQPVLGRAQTTPTAREVGAAEAPLFPTHGVTGGPDLNIFANSTPDLPNGREVTPGSQTGSGATANFEFSPLNSSTWVNPLDVPSGGIEFDVGAQLGAQFAGASTGASSTGRSGSGTGSVKTDDDEHVFDWDRFFDKNEEWNFDI